MNDDGSAAAALAALIAKDRIRQLALLYCRASDRRDFDLMRSLYHEDATDDHGGMFKGPAMEFIDRLPQIMADIELTTHHITNHLIALHPDGVRAEGELNIIAYHRVQTPDGPQDAIIGGRYLDHYECRDGSCWKFAARKIVLDWNRIGPSLCDFDHPTAQGVARCGAADDPSYALLPLMASLNGNTPGIDD